MSESAELGEAVPRELSRLIDAGWVVAAFAVLQRGEAKQELRDAAEQVLLLSGLPTNTRRNDEFLAAVSSQLQQIAGLGSGKAHGWADLDDDVLLIQGQGSRIVADWILDEIVPALGMGERMRQPAAAFLDVGVGTGQLAAQIVRRCPEVRVVGLDTASRPLRLARDLLQESGHSERIELRLADVASLDETSVFDLAWLPVCFIAPDLLETAVARVLRSLRRGGVVVASTIISRTDLPIVRAVVRLMTTFYGGTPFTQEDVMRLLAQAGYTDVRSLPANAVTGALTGGRRP